MPPQRRFTPPWKVTEHEESFEVMDANGRNICFVYYADEKRGAYYMNVQHTRDEARRIAAGIARLPELIALETRSRNEP